ncbi:tRNA (adenosine(37)-N6)-threonylcarbamoyltransferase complex dimerization subunit type 1 TsaB [Corynebacterium lizhenjunii]|uniref:tRNA (adenosine(37)-N6)-threonylcarbamoyltransferase complex dimerization subunit type 1 TsaB n=1 Tax=Corynebacterium lizhenjunii TaxID=2709394 RepID=UPI0013EC354B|nr:tRNA (adenosine(37)-N6)-threonylcarbamoyltransferase complex dimerization subunit type 1 TsaB [Corynebacterium lizhenjunii]
MRILALDTATTDLVTGAVDTATGQSWDRVVEDTRAHNEQLMPTVEALLAQVGWTYADLDAVVVGTGPGPFTGLRVGMATASALGVALNIPVFGVCSLDAIAHRVAATAPAPADLLVATDARRKEVYWATYRGTARTSGPQVHKPEELEATAQQLVFPEAIAPRLPQQLQSLPRQWATPRAAGLVAVAGDLQATPEPLVPLYLRRPDAVPPQPAPRSAALPPLEHLQLGDAPVPFATSEA